MPAINNHSERAIHYFDSATTSYPKPPEVRQALASFYDQPIGSYGRSFDQHTIAVSSAVEVLRERLASILGVATPEHICFTDNASTALNTIIAGRRLQSGDVVLLSPMEHNAVVRPLAALADQSGLQIVTMPAMPDGTVDIDRLCLKLPARSRFAVINVESNVNGVIQPVEDLCRLLHSRGIETLLDTAQWLDARSRLRADNTGIDYIVFSGHKGLLGPTGVGGFYIRDPRQVRPLTVGGNGYNSRESMITQTMPERYSAGTPNLLGLYTLSQALAKPPRRLVSRSRFVDWLTDLATIEGLQIYRAGNPGSQGFVASLRHEHHGSAEIAETLYRKYGIITRHGIHCAPMAHRHLGTSATGALRLSLSPYQTQSDLDYFQQALFHVLRDK